MICFSEQYVEIKWDEAYKILILTFGGFMTSEQIHLTYEKLLECLIKFKANKILMDSRKFTTIRPEDQEWLEKYWQPRVFKAIGKTKTAGILPENMIQKQVINKIVDNAKANPQAEFRFFSKIEDALIWLRV